MNDALITYWNEVVKHEDTVYILGDFAFTGAPKKVEIARRLNGKKKIVLGNHDDKSPSHWARCDFEVIEQGMTEFGFNVSHFPYKDTIFDERDFGGRQLKDDGNWLLHGHVHRGWKVNGRMINVGVDVWNLRPVSLEAIKSLMVK